MTNPLTRGDLIPDPFGRSERPRIDAERVTAAGVVVHRPNDMGDPRDAAWEALVTDLYLDDSDYDAVVDRHRSLIDAAQPAPLDERYRALVEAARLIVYHTDVLVDWDETNGYVVNSERDALAGDVSAAWVDFRAALAALEDSDD